MKNLKNLKKTKILSREDQKLINGGSLIKLCAGTGTGGVTTLGFSTACIGQPQKASCTINGGAAACTGNGGGFWFY